MVDLDWHDVGEDGSRGRHGDGEVENGVRQVEWRQVDAHMWLI